ncbi:hypothetical protein [Amycolatopsis magusensis]|uniref:hypothetical protein n=1 Tax=Amycolatopsis magusensis TaxID=882444 RepID=UPI003C2F0959
MEVTVKHRPPRTSQTGADGGVGGDADRLESVADAALYGADKVVQQALGHADAAMTLNVYGHLFPNRLDEVADVGSIPTASRAGAGGAAPAAGRVGLSAPITFQAAALSGPVRCGLTVVMVQGGPFYGAGTEKTNPLSDRVWRMLTAFTGAGCLIVVAGLVVPGKVVSVDGTAKVVHAEVEFVTLAGEYVRTQAWRPYWAPTEVGEVWQVRYNPHDPWWYPEDVRVPDNDRWPISAV